MVSGLDPSMGRNFKELQIYERVLDTGDRTISIDSIATVSIETRKRWKWRLAAALLALYCGAMIVSSLRIPAEMRIFSSIVPLEAWIAVLALAVLTALFFRDVTYLQIGASDGSRTIFRSKDRAFLAEVKAFLLAKINERNTAATNYFHFGDHISGDKIAGDKQTTTTTTTVHGTGNQVVTGNVETRSFEGPSVNQAIGAAMAQVGTGHTATGNALTLARIDFRDVLPQVTQMRDFYASQPRMEHLEQRLSELETLMKQGGTTRESRSRMRDLAVDLGTILQAYPTVVQIFQHIARLVG